MNLAPECNGAKVRSEALNHLARRARLLLHISRPLYIKAKPACRRWIASGHSGPSTAASDCLANLAVPRHSQSASNYRAKSASPHSPAPECSSTCCCKGHTQRRPGYGSPGPAILQQQRPCQCAGALHGIQWHSGPVRGKQGRISYQ